MQNVRPILFSGPMVRALLDGRKTQTRRLFKLPTKTHSGGPIYERKDMGGWEATTLGGGGCFTIGPGGECIAVQEHPAIWHRTTGVCAGAPYAVGGLLWVRETTVIAPPRWTDTPANPRGPHRQETAYLADNDCMEAARDYGLKKTPSIFMPRWASRITLEITDVRVQRLQDISEADAIAEGVSKIRDNCYAIKGFDYDLSGLGHNNSIIPFAKLWERINGPGKEINGEWVSAWELNPWIVALTFNVHKLNIDAFLQQREAA